MDKSGLDWDAIPPAVLNSGQRRLVEEATLEKRREELGAYPAFWRPTLIVHPKEKKP
jgi:hypothetical protein